MNTSAAHLQTRQDRVGEPHPPKPAARVNHFAFIDALRGLAALYVVLFHMLYVPTFKPVAPPALTAILSAGGSGVVLFFVISAFTLSYSMRERAREPHAVPCFYVRRIFRIVPLFYAWILVSAVRDAYVFHQGWPTLPSLGLSLLFGFNFFPSHVEGIVWASWTLGVEMVVYLLFPFVFLWIDDLRKAAAFFVGSLLAALGFHRFLAAAGMPEQARTHYFHLSLANQVPVFTLGILAFLLFERFIWRKPKNTWSGVILLAASALAWLLLTLQPFSLAFLPAAPSQWHLYGVTYAVTACALAIAPVRFLVNRVTLFYGKISYSLYLNHPTVVLLLSPVYRRICGWPIGTASTWLLCVLTTLAILTPLSYLTYRLIEQPGNRTGRWLIQKFLSRPMLAESRSVDRR